MSTGTTRKSKEMCVLRTERLLVIRPLVLVISIIGSVALVARRTNDRMVAGSRPTKVVCITVLTGNRMRVNCPLWPPLLLPSCRKTVSVDGLGSGMGKW